MPPALVARLHRRARARWRIDGRAGADAAAAFHQVASARHRDLLELEILQSFDAARAPDDPPNAALERFGPDLATAAAHAYEIALALAPALAEARYNRAALDRRAGRQAAALAGYTAVLAMAPHPRAPAHALLHANAAWEAAKLAERAQPAEADALFARAIAGLDNFGVEHGRYAAHLDRRGRTAEALTAYDRLTRYAHRYAPEFIEPAWDADEALPTGPDGRPLDPLAPAIVARAGDHAAVYFLHLYFCVPRPRDDLAGMLVAEIERSWWARLTRRGASSIVACARRLAELPGFG